MREEDSISVRIDEIDLHIKPIKENIESWRKDKYFSRIVNEHRKFITILIRDIIKCKYEDYRRLFYLGHKIEPIIEYYRSYKGDRAYIVWKSYLQELHLREIGCTLGKFSLDKN